MTKRTIAEVMTRMPHSVGQDQPVKAAQQLMHRHGIRHLPVKYAGELAGVVSERDIELAMRIEVESNATLKVSDVMIPEMYSVPTSEDLAAVAGTMAEKRIGCALVTDDRNQLAGIFTSVDACRVLAEILTTNCCK
jgi:CBS domain-containing protein